MASDDVQENYLENLRNRQAADEEIEAREERLRQRQQIDEGYENQLERLGDRERQELESDEDDELEEPGVERRLNLDAFDCPLREWIGEDRTRREIQSRFKKFLQTFYVGIEKVTQWQRKHKDDVPMPPCPFKILPPVYPAKIRAMCAENRYNISLRNQ